MMNSRPKRRPDSRYTPFRRLRAGAAAMMESRAFTVTVSLLMAIMIWGALVASDGTLTREKAFANVAVNVTGETSLKSRGYIVMDDLQELLPGVKLVVEVTQQNYSRVSGTSYNPYLDLSKVKGEGANEIAISFSSQLYGPVLECEPSSVTVNVERYITRRIPVSLEIVGAAPQGVYLDSAKSDPTMLSVSGPQSLVLKVARAVAKLDASTLSPQRLTDRTALNIVLQDTAGKTIESDKLEVTNQTVITNSIVAETELVPMKQIPLDQAAFVTGEPAQGYELTSIELASEALDVAASEETLNALSVITTEQPLDITDARETVTGYVRIKRPSGIQNTLPTEVSVTAHIAEKSEERTMRKIPVEIEGLGGGLSASLSREYMTVQLTGAYSFITALEDGDIRLYVDVSGLGAGRYDLPVQIHVDNAQPFECALSSPEVTVSIREP